MHNNNKKKITILKLKQKRVLLVELL